MSTEGNVQAGDEAEWQLTVVNVGTSEAVGTITVTDDLPPGLAYVSAGGPGWACAEVDSVVTCTHPGPLAVGDDLVVALVTDVDDSLTGTVTNNARVSLAGDVNVLNNAATAAVGLLPNTGFELADVLTGAALLLLLGGALLVIGRRQALVRKS